MTTVPAMTKQQLTQFLGVSRPVCDRLIAEGLPAEGEAGRQRFDPKAVARWLLVKAEATGGGPAVDRERQRLLAAQASKAELELAKARGELVCAKEVEQVWSTTLRAARDTFRMMPASAADRLLAEAPKGRAPFARALLWEVDDTLRRIVAMDHRTENKDSDNDAA